MRAPQAYAPVSGGWGRMGSTVCTLSALTEEELADALTLAWKTAQRRPKSAAPPKKRRAASLP